MPDGMGHVQRHQDQGPVDAAEPVRHVFGDDNEIAFGDHSRGAAFDAGATEVLGVIALLVHQFAAGHHGGGAVDYVEDLRFLFMNGSRANGAPIFQTGVIGGQLYDRLSEHRLIRFPFGFCLGDHSGYIRGRSEGLHLPWVLSHCHRGCECESETNSDYAHVKSPVSIRPVDGLRRMVSHATGLQPTSSITQPGRLAGWLPSNTTRRVLGNGIPVWMARW